LNKKEKEAIIISDEEGTIEYKPSTVKLLNVLIVILSLLLIIIIYVPNKIWQEEEYFRNIGRKRMSILYEVEKYLNQMSGRYFDNPYLATKLLTAVRDSTRADSNFYGEQVIKIPEGTFTLDVVQNFYKTFDTTFSISYEVRDTVVDTSYQITKWNAELFTFDTLWVHSSRIGEVLRDPMFRAVIDTEITSRVATEILYRRFTLDSEIVENPLTGEPFLVLIDSSGIAIKDPMKGYKERRYFVFTFSDTNYGYIKNGEKSWERR